jgi:hypothetical protein
MHRLLLLAALLPACTTVSSTEVLTSEIYAAINAETTGDGKTTVTATLFVDSPITLDFVELEGGDSLVAKTGSQSKPMVERENLNTIVHDAELDGDAEGASFEVAFVRDVDAGAPRSVATLPAKFEIMAPPTTASRAMPLVIAWSPAGSPDAMAWTASGSCIEDAAGPIIGDPGTVMIGPDLIKQRMGTGIADQCTMSISIERKRPGMLDAHYRQGVIHGTQVRMFFVTSTP